MSGVNSVNNYFSEPLARFNPEPKNRLGGKFRDMMSSIGSALTSVASSAIPGASAIGLGGDYQAMINKQIEVQQQMQIMTFESNIEKSKHETKMAAIRNLRAS